MDTPESTPSHAAVAEEENAISAPETISAPIPWHPLTRLGFRIAFIYFICFILLYGNGSIFISNYVAGGWIGNLVNWPLNHLAVWSGRHIFHLANVPANWRVTHLGDRMINWVLDRLFIAGALIGGLVWTGIAWQRGSRRTEYNTLLAWLRFLLRLSVGFFMIGYGMLKVFPLQMAPISIAILNQPAGQMTPEMLLWSAIGLYPLYQSICGIAEVIAGGLVLFRRTALAGALMSVFLMINVVLYNFFFGVAVKLFALNLLLAAIFIVLPDLKPLLNFFWRHESAVQTGIWTPPAPSRGLHLYVRALEVIFIAALFTIDPLVDSAMWYHQRVVACIQSPLLGGWQVDSSTHPATGAFITPTGPVVELYVDTVERGMRRSQDGTLWHAILTVNSAVHTLVIKPVFDRTPVSYDWRMPDVNHLILTAMAPNVATRGSKAAQNVKPRPVFSPDVVTLTRIPLPAHYRLLDRSFHFVSHGATER